MLAAFITKTAIFPFRRWLPIAMAAPTPIRALVHRRTLVTAGLYLFMRFSAIFYRNYLLMKVLVILRIMTSFYAGAIAVVEHDFKKLIALSTLRHLGFILIRFRVGLTKFAFLHLVAHALFKSLLFLSFGGIMAMQRHRQDYRSIRIN